MRARRAPQLIAGVGRPSSRDTGTMLVSRNSGECCAARIEPGAITVARATAAHAARPSPPRNLGAPFEGARGVPIDLHERILKQESKSTASRDDLQLLLSEQAPSNNAMQLTGRPRTHLAVSAPPHISPQGSAQGARHTARS